MNDFIFVILFGTVMAAAYGYVALCSRIIERDRADTAAQRNPTEGGVESGDLIVGVVAS